MQKQQLKNRIAFYRKRNGLSQKELAESAGVKQSQISRWESGNMPSLPNLDRLSCVLGCSIDELLHHDITDADEEEQND